MRISQLRNKRVPLAIDLFDDVLNVVYDPTYLTPEVEDAIEASTTSEEMASILSGMLVEWDLLNDDESPFELTPEKLKTLPTVVLAMVVNKVAEHTQVVVRGQGKVSAAISAPKAS
jgi:hypothetical protein